MTASQTTFCDPFTQSILDHGLEVAERMTGPLFLDADGKLWNRVTPGLLQWMSERIEERFAREIEDDGPLSRSIDYYHRLIDASGMCPSGVATEPQRLGMSDPEIRALRNAIEEHAIEG